MYLMIVIYASSSLALVGDIALTRSIIYNRNMFTAEIVTYYHKKTIVNRFIVKTIGHTNEIIQAFLSM